MAKLTWPLRFPNKVPVTLRHGECDIDSWILVGIDITLRIERRNVEMFKNRGLQPIAERVVESGLLLREVEEV